MHRAERQQTPDATAVRRALELLGAAVGSQPAELARAYRQQARRLHPDLSGDPRATERFRTLHAAYRLALRAALEAPRSAPSSPLPESPTTDADQQRRRTQVPGGSDGVTSAATSLDDGVWVVAGPVQVRAATTPGSSKDTGGRRP